MQIKFSEVEAPFTWNALLFFGFRGCQSCKNFGEH